MQPDRKGSLIHITGRLNSSPVQVGNLLRNGKSDSGASNMLAARFIHSEKSIKYIRQIPRGNLFPVIGYFDNDYPAFLASAYIQIFSKLPIFDGVRAYILKQHPA